MYSKKLRLIIVAVGLFLSGTKIIATEQDFKTKIANMITTNLPGATVGVILQDARSGKILYDYHGNKHFLPASTTKLFTAAAALQELGPLYKYETSLYYALPNIDHAERSSEVALKFTGDPSFKLVNLQSLLKKLRQAKIKEITGDLLVDDSIFDGPLLGHGWTWDSAAWYYAAPVSAIIIDYNQLGVTLFPTKEIGGTVVAKLDSNFPGANTRELKAKLIGVTYQDSETKCQIHAEVDDQNHVAINGCWPIGTEQQHLKLAIKNPRLQAKTLILEALKLNKIKLHGKIKFAKVPANLTKLAHHESEPLYLLLNAILGESNNLYAESLVKTMGARLFGIGSFKTGSLAVQQILTKSTGIDFAQARLHDGSGASRYNLLTPVQLSRLLYTMLHEASIGKYFRDAMAISGVNGTLQQRFASFDTKASIQAKTGTLAGVSALSGYLTTRSQRELIVTIMINHAATDGAALKRFENELCYFLVNQV